jgi:tryptophan synthase beta subunit
MRAAARMKKTQTVVVGLSGRGDKDVHTVGLALDARPGHGLGGNGHGGAR